MHFVEQNSVMRAFAVLYIATLLAVNGDCKDKRGTDDYSSASTVKPITENSQPTYTGTKFNSPPYVAPKAVTYSSPQQLNYVVQPTPYKFAAPQQAVSQPQIPAYKFVAAPQASGPQISFLPSQQQYDVNQQNFAYAQPSLPKAAPAIPKVAYAPIQTPVQAPIHARLPPIQYSSAGEVSSFKYSSPLVTYSNLGVLSQVNGKSSQAAPAEAAATRVAVEQPQQPQHQQEVQLGALQQFLYRPRLQIPQIPQYQQSQPVIPKIVYSQAPQLSQASAPQYQPQQVQKLSGSIPQQLVFNRPQQFVYTPAQPTAPAQTQPVHSASQPVFVIAPQYQAQYQTQNAAYQQQ